MAWIGFVNKLEQALLASVYGIQPHSLALHAQSKLNDQPPSHRHYEKHFNKSSLDKINYQTRTLSTNNYKTQALAYTAGRLR